MKWSLPILACLTSVLVLAAGSHGQPPASKPAVVVNGETIPLTELEAVLKAIQPPSTTPLTQAQVTEMRAGALNMLIEDLLMRQYLRQNAPPANAQEIDKEMQELVAALAKENRTLADFLKESGQNEAQLRADVAARLQWKGFVTPRLSDEAVKQYYDTNKIFFDKVMVQASHILLKVAPNATPADKQMIANRLQAIRQEILAGKVAFEKAAETYSECPSKMNGGNLGFFPYKFAVKEQFARAAFSMKIGDVSDLVETEFGYHLIKVLQRTPGEPSDFAKIKTEVKELYAQEIYQYIIGEQRKAARIDTAQ